MALTPEQHAHSLALSEALNDDDYQELAMYLKGTGHDTGFLYQISWPGAFDQLAVAQLKTGAISTEPSSIITGLTRIIDKFVDQVREKDDSPERTR